MRKPRPSNGLNRQADPLDCLDLSAPKTPVAENTSSAGGLARRRLASGGPRNAANTDTTNADTTKDMTMPADPNLPTQEQYEEEQTKTRAKVRKLTRGAATERIMFAVHLLSRKFYQAEVSAILARRYSTTHDQAHKYIQQAQELIRLRCGRLTLQQCKENSVSFYESIIRDPSIDIGVKMSAQARIDMITGVYAPVKINNTDGDGNTVTPQAVRQVILSNDAARIAFAELAEKVAGLDLSAPIPIEPISSSTSPLNGENGEKPRENGP